MTEKERNTLIPAVISVWCTRFKTRCHTCWCMLPCCDEEHGWRAAKAKAEQRCSHRCHHSIPLLTLSFTLSPYQTHTVCIRLQYDRYTKSLLHIIVFVSLISGHGCLTAKSTGPQRVAIWQSAWLPALLVPKANQMRVPWLLVSKGMLHLRWQGSTPLMGRRYRATPLSLAELAGPRHSNVVHVFRLKMLRLLRCYFKWRWNDCWCCWGR